MAERINWSPIDLEFQKPIRRGECWIDLYDTYFHFFGDFDASEPHNIEDLKQGWKDVKTKIDLVIKKDRISGIEKSLTFNEKWVVSIICFGVTKDVQMYFNNEAAAIKMKTKLTSWAGFVKYPAPDLSRSVQNRSFDDDDPF